MSVYILYRLGHIFIKTCPVAWHYPIADFVGFLCYCTLHKRRRVVINNLRHIFPLFEGEASLHRLARAVFRNYARYFVDFLMLPNMEHREIRGEGVENMLKVLERGKGAILLTAHLGSWDVGGYWLAHTFHNVTSVVEQLPVDRVFDMYRDLRAKGGWGVIAGIGGLKKILKALARNEVITLMGDRDTEGNGLEMKFFGSMTTMPREPVTLALRTGAAIVPGFVLRRGDSFHCKVFKEIELEKTDDMKESIRINVEKVARFLEKQIALHPDQWLVFQPVWKEDQVG